MRSPGTIAIAACALAACADPPRLVVHGPQRDVVSGVLELEVETDARRARVSVDGGPWREVDADAARLDTRGWPDGPHQVAVAVSSWFGGTAETRLTLTTDNTPPDITLWEDGLAVEQGHTLPVVVRADEDVEELAVDFLDEDRPLYPVGERTWRALVGVPIRTAPGPHPLRITASDPYGNVQEHTVEIDVQAVDWPFTGKLPLSRREARVDPPAVQAMREARDAVYAAATPAQRWSGPMRLPVDGAEHTSAFGTFREYPDGTRSHHDAEDLARKRGVPVHAAADGVVALARHQAVHGNAVLLDHGQQVVSLYSHLQALDVQEGQHVDTGDRLGTMGSTGRSTGPHLHWGVVVDEVPVDPMQWTERGFEPGPDAIFVPLGEEP